jgi:aryl sulfotransferase
MSSPTIKRNLNWLREARDAGPRVIACLSAAGFDISEDELLVLGATATKGDAAGDVTRAFGFTRERDNQVASALLARGYLESQDGPDDRGRPSVAVSGRGRSLLRVTLDAALAARWNSFPFRQGDIVISTPSKCGTTWMQMICALLIFQTPELPAPLPELSPWLEMRQNDRDEMFARLAAQRHRRFIKTHLPLSEICVDGRATYIVMARHPLDAAASMYRLAEHTDRSGSGHEASRLHESLLRWLDQGPSLPEDRDSLPGRLRHLADAWVRRAEPNVMLVHYEDLAADLEGEMRRLAARLGIRVPEAAWPSLVKAATFEQMRAAAGHLQPWGDDLNSDPAAFFWRGMSGSGRALLTSAELARYHARAAELAPADMLAWLHRDPGTC